jgi:hypothetical protein
VKCDDENRLLTLADALVAEKCGLLTPRQHTPSFFFCLADAALHSQHNERAKHFDRQTHLATMSSTLVSALTPATTTTSSRRGGGARASTRSSSSLVGTLQSKTRRQQQQQRASISCAASTTQLAPKSRAEGGAQDIASFFGSLFSGGGGGGGGKKEARRVEAKEALLDAIAGTERGVKATEEDAAAIDAAARDLERLNPNGRVLVI